MDKKNDLHWFNEILRIEKEHPFLERTPDNEHNLNCINSFTEEQVDDYFMIGNRREYLLFIRSRKDELSESSYLWLFEDLPNHVAEEYCFTSEDLKKSERETA